MIIPFLLMSMVVVSKLGLNEFSIFSYLLNQNWLDLVSTFRANSINLSGRSTYGISLDPTSSYMVVYSGFKVVCVFFVCPFPMGYRGFKRFICRHGVYHAHDLNIFFSKTMV